MEADYSQLQHKYNSLAHKANKYQRKFQSLSQHRFATGLGDDEKIGETIKIKGNTLDSYNYLGMREEPAAAAAGGKRTDSGPVRGDKDAIVQSNDLEEFGNKQTTSANTRLPYVSTLTFLGEEPAGAPAAGAPADGAAAAGGAATEARTGPVRGDKTAVVVANTFVDYEDGQTTVANTRPPYNSTLQLSAFTQLGEEPAGQARNDNGPLRGDHVVLTDSQELVDWENKQTTSANTRIPYASTLTQLSEEPAT